MCNKTCAVCKNTHGDTPLWSLWWYCNNPKDFRDFTIVNRDSNFVPKWCPSKDKELQNAAY